MLLHILEEECDLLGIFHSTGPCTKLSFYALNFAIFYHAIIGKMSQKN